MKSSQKQPQSIGEELIRRDAVVESAKAAAELVHEKSMRRINRANKLLGYLIANRYESGPSVRVLPCRTSHVQEWHHGMVILAGPVHDGQWFNRVDRDSDHIVGALWAFDCIERAFFRIGSEQSVSAAKAFGMMLSCIPWNSHIERSYSIAFEPASRSVDVELAFRDLWQEIVSTEEWQQFSLFYKDLRDAELN